MAEKRKDSKGRVLKTGESQRKDGRYLYSCTIAGKRRVVYAWTLEELRAKEEKLKRQIDNGIDYNANKLTVISIVRQYIEQIENVLRENTVKSYKMWLKMIEKEPVMWMKAAKFDILTAKAFVKKLQANGMSYSTIKSIVGLIKTSYATAAENGIRLPCPFVFTLTKVITDDRKERIPLSNKECADWLNFLEGDNVYSKYYDMFALLLYTGIREGELCGLTISDIDLKHNQLLINKQLAKKKGGIYYVAQPKTKSGVRSVGLSPEAVECLKHAVRHRLPPVTGEVAVDGYTDFLFLNQAGNPFIGADIYNTMKRARKKYNALHPDHPINIHPHLCRHTLCTSLVRNNMPLKDAQLMMGHATPAQIMNVYAHADNATAAKEMAKIVDMTNWRAQTSANHRAK